MRFELFDGIRAVGMVRWEAPGRVVIDVDDPGVRAQLVRSFGGRAADAVGPGRSTAVVLREDLDANAFEAACLQLQADHGLTAIPRPWPGGPGGPAGPVGSVDPIEP